MYLVLLLVPVGLVTTQTFPFMPCQTQVTTTNQTLNQVYCAQPVFYSLLPKIPLTMTLNAVCFTLSTVPGNHDMKLFNQVRDFSNRTSDLKVFIANQKGVSTFIGSPFLSGFDRPIGRVCDSDLYYRCYKCGVYFPPYVFAFTSVYKQMNESCLKKAKALIQLRGIPVGDYVTPPMKPPQNCLTVQSPSSICTDCPSQQLGSVYKMKTNLVREKAKYLSPQVYQHCGLML